ncbi:ISL3 family transposase [Enterococcus sp. AZ196]|uniref:ISL3 family transposase n=1 Tax=Enterococcus sp. AZ196 TaxID=2774659 RepID=UPI003D2BE2D8
MKYHEINWCPLFFGDDYFIYDSEEDPETIRLFIKSKPHPCTCPYCGSLSCKLHGTYVRRFQDTPIHGKLTYLYATLFNYDCLNTDCLHQTFTESLPFAKPYQVRTDALNTFILGVSIFLSNECASHVLSLMGVIISNDTIQSLYDQLSFIDDPDISAIGVDDVAIKKGNSYATAIYDFNDHHLLALLDGREAKPLENWLAEHPKIELVTRDRAEAYATAITNVLPDCVQVADRFHLFQNLITHLKEVFKAELPEKFFIQKGELLKKEPKKIRQEKAFDHAYLDTLYYDNSVPRNSDGTEKIFDNKKHDITDSSYQKRAQNRMEKQQLIRGIRAYWESSNQKDIRVMAGLFDIHPVTLKRYLNMTEEQIEQMNHPKNYKKHKSGMDPYLNMIFKMMADGLPDDTIYYYLRKQGCDRKESTIWSYLYLISKNNFPNRGRMNRIRLTEFRYPDDVVIFTRNQLVKVITTVNPKTKRNKTVENYLSLLEESYPVISTLKEAFKSFHSILMGDRPEKMDEFLATYENSSIANFCQSIKKDIAPVKNAISSNVSSGFVEGNNNKFKLIKRIVYGRSGLVNLSRKCQLAFSATLDNFSLQGLL